MPKRSSKQKDQLARSVLDAIVPNAEPKPEKPSQEPRSRRPGPAGRPQGREGTGGEVVAR